MDCIYLVERLLPGTGGWKVTFCLREHQPGKRFDIFKECKIQDCVLKE